VHASTAHSSATYINQNAPPYLALEQLAGHRYGFAQTDLTAKHLQLGGIEVTCQALPRFKPLGSWAHHTIDACQGHAAQNEGSNRARKIHAASEAAGGYYATVLHGRADIGQSMASDDINGTRPTFLGDRFGG